MTICEEIARQVGELFACSQVRDHVRIRTPFLYPDGDVIDVFLKPTGNETTITDFGETLGWLRTQTGGRKRTIKQLKLIDDVCIAHGVNRHRGELSIRAEPSNYAEAIFRLAQGCLRVSDVWFTYSARSIESANDEVQDFLEEHSISFERQKQLVGRSGKPRFIDFQTVTPRKTSLIQVLSTYSRATTTRMLEHVVAVWFDLNHFQESSEFISLVDDTVEVWRPEDFRQLEQLSTVSQWSNPDRFLQTITI
jgi:hypothetical protein